MLLKNGTIATEQGTQKADIRIDGERIHEIGEGLAPFAGETVTDLTGRLILPGGVDAHTHLDAERGELRSTDDFYTGTVAAACGGTTTVIDHLAYGPEGSNIRHQVEEYHLLAHGRAVIDYGFHGVMDHVDDRILGELEGLVVDGITSYKIRLSGEGKLSDRELLRLLERTKELGVLVAVHPENDGAVAHLREKFLRAGKTMPIYYARSSPPEAEAEAVNRAVLLASIAGNAPLYIDHLSTGLGAEIIRSARWRGQRYLFAETCPQYLLLDESRYFEPDALRYITEPPLRAQEHPRTLWRALRGGDIDAVATDHRPFFEKEKQQGRGDFSKTPEGVPGVETRIPLLYEEVEAGKLALEQLVKLCCGNPARLFGLYPKKGVIAPGSDADLAVINPARRQRISQEMLHENTDYTLYEGVKTAGFPELTISRGEVVVREGVFVGQRGRGRYLRRGLPDLKLRESGPIL